MARPPAAPAPATVPPAPPNTQQNRPPNTHPPPINGTHHPSQHAKAKKKPDPPVDPATMYESLKNRIAALEEEEVLEEEEERRFGVFFEKASVSLENSMLRSP